MSLIHLLKWHKFVVQTNRFTSQERSGALDRKDGWINLPNAINILGHFQNTVASGKKGKDDAILEYGKREFELWWTLFHNHKFLATISPANRVLINVNPRVPVDFDDPTNIRIFEVISAREPVALRQRGLTLFEVYLKQITRQSL